MHFPKRVLPLLLASAIFLLAFPGCAWFVIGGVAAGVLAVQAGEEENRPPAVSVTDPVRMKNSPGELHFILIDPDEDACSIIVEVSVDGASFGPATAGPGGDGTLGLASSKRGTPHVFSWDFASDVTPPQANLRIRITPADGEGPGAASVTAPFYAGNDLPVVESIPLAPETVTGTVIVKYTLSDTESDASEIQVQFNRLASGGTWVDAAPDDPTALLNVATAPNPGLEHLYPWDSDAPGNLPDEDGAVNRIRIRASDDGGANWGAWLEASAVLTILNNSAPRLVIDPSDPLQNGLVSMPYTCSDNGSHTVSVLCEYLEAGSSNWKRATAGPGTTPLRFATSPAGVSAGFVWDTRKDGVFSTNVTVRMTPSETGLVGFPDSTNFFIGNDDNDAWRTRAPLPTARKGLAAAVVGGRLWALGGEDNTQASLDTVEVYDPVTDTWSIAAPMPTARSHLACAVAQGKIYAVGGTDGSSALAVTEAYDPATDTWTARAPMSTARSHLAACQAFGLVWAVAGKDGAVTAALESYDPASNTWTARASIPTARANFAVVQEEGILYALGGEDGTLLVPTLEAYDPGTGAWTLVTLIPTQREQLVATSVGGRIYAFGAYASGSGPATVEMYEPFSNTWAVRTAMPTGRWSPACASLAGRIYVLGGANVFTVLDTVETYDPPARTWSAKAPMPAASCELGVVAAGGKVVAAGGWNGSALSTTEVWDPVADAWAAGTAMSAARRGACAASSGRYAFLLGGDNGSVLNTVERYDPAGDQWTGRAPMPTARAWASCAEIGGRIYVVGGTDGSSPLSVLEVFDPVANNWQTLAPMPTARMRLGAACVGGRLFAVGGVDGTAFRAEVEVYDPESGAWAAASPMPTARDSFACASVGGLIFATGGWNGTVLDVSEAFDPVRDAWTVQPRLPSARLHESRAVIGPRFIAAGGWDGSSYLSVTEELFVSLVPVRTDLPALSPERSGASLVIAAGRAFLLGGRNFASTALDAHASFPLAQDVPAAIGTPFTFDSGWASRAVLPSARRDAGAVEHNGRIVLVGGISGTGVTLSDLQRYDPASDAWTALTATLATNRAGHGLARIGNRMYVFGGRNSSAVKLASLEIYNLQTGLWEPGPHASMNQARSNFGHASFEGQLLAFGGEGPGGAVLNAVEKYDPASNVWTVLGNLPEGLAGALCLLESGRLRLFGGEEAGSAMSDRIRTYEHQEDSWRIEKARLPYAARDLAGYAASCTWSHRAANQTREFCLIGGGFDGTAHRDGFFRYATR